MINKSTNRTRTNWVGKCLTHCSRLGWWGLAGLRSGGCWRGWVDSCRRCRRRWVCCRLRAARPDFGFGRSSSPSVGVVFLCVRLTWRSSESFRSHIRDIWRLVSHKQTRPPPHPSIGCVITRAWRWSRLKVCKEVACGGAQNITIERTQDLFCHNKVYFSLSHPDVWTERRVCRFGFLHWNESLVFNAI